MLVKIDVGLSKPDLHDTSLGLVLLFQQNWINGWIDAFFEILNEKRLSSPNACCDISEEGVRTKLEQLKTVVLFKILDPFIGLLLWIDTKSISFCLNCENTVFTGDLVIW